MKTAAQKKLEGEETREIELIGGPYAGEKVTDRGFVEGHYIECHGPWDAQGHMILDPSVYRYTNGAFQWRDPSKKGPPTEKCLTCGGRGHVMKWREAKFLDEDCWESGPYRIMQANTGCFTLYCDRGLSTEVYDGFELLDEAKQKAEELEA
jgi:hypothetical protein